MVSGLCSASLRPPHWQVRLFKAIPLTDRHPGSCWKQTKTVVLKLEHASESVGGPVKKISDSVALRELENDISNKFLGDAEAAVPGTHIENQSTEGTGTSTGPVTT